MWGVSTGSTTHTDTSCTMVYISGGGLLHVATAGMEGVLTRAFGASLPTGEGLAAPVAGKSRFEGCALAKFSVNMNCRCAGRKGSL